MVLSWSCIEGAKFYAYASVNIAANAQLHILGSTSLSAPFSLGISSNVTFGNSLNSLPGSGSITVGDMGNTI